MRTVALSVSRSFLESLRSNLKTSRPSTVRLCSTGVPDLAKTDVKFSKRHEWISKDGRVGVTHYAQDALGDIVYVAMPEVGLVVKRYDVCGALESVKAASEVYSPLDGR